MQRFTVLLMSLLPLTANSAEYDVAYFSNKKFRISIFHDQGHTVQYTKFINGEEDLASYEFHEYPFDEECTFKGHVDYPTPSSFSCHDKGRTPLAGATYKLIEYGKSKSSCASDRDRGARYICIKGCENPMAPKYLEAFDGMC